MGIEHLQDHLADVRKVLGQEEIPKDSLRFGAEIELGWRSEEVRNLFFRALDKADLDEVCISKHDGTIGATPSEIVSLPLRPYQMREFLDSIGSIIESLADKGLRTQGCGVHFHASRAPIDKNAAWRIAQGIVTDTTYIKHWHSRTGTQPTRKTNNDAALMHEFLSMVALRGPGRYCQRTPAYANFAQFQKHTQHDRGFISGRVTPTYEWRIFRTARSKRVLLSQFDLVESMVDFATNAPKELLGPPPSKPAKKQLPLSDYYIDTGRRDALWAGNFGGANMNREVLTRYDFPGLGAFYFPNPETCDRLGFRAPANEAEMNSLLRNGPGPAARAGDEIGAQSWIDHVWPLKEYTSYVTERAEQYPALARRLTLERFLPFTVQAPPEIPFDFNEPHLDFRPGCTVLCDEVDDHTTMVITDLSEKGRAYCYYGERSADTTYRASLESLSHLCPGAMEKGGEQ
jgi:hypothetical protein